MTSSAAAGFAVYCLMSTAGFAQSPGAARDWAPNEKPVLNIAPAAGPITIDGELNDPGWAGAARAGNFSETFPGEKSKPPIDIEAFIAYDEDYLFVAFKITDDPAAVRASLCDRDKIWNDDYSGIILYTYGNTTWGYFIAANPLGIQGDTRLSSVSGEDVGFDLVYHSAGRLTESGYEVEMAIPFKSLRFPDREEQEWHGTLWITHPRRSRSTYSWAAFSRDDPCDLCQNGLLRGIRGVKAGANLDLLPAVIASRASHPSQADGSRLEHGPIKGEPSIGLRYSFSSSTMVEAALNPDFSQVESDASQIDVNTTFALFYDEHRPFFMEGGDLLNTQINAVYTRSINNPLAAAKLTMRPRGTALMFLGAYDENSPALLPFEERSGLLPDAGGSWVSILRARQSFWEDSYAGALITDRRFADGGSGSVAGIDGSLRFLTHNRLRFQALASHTRESTDSSMTARAGLNSVVFNDGRLTARFDGESFTGYAWTGGIEHSSEFYNGEVAYNETSPAFRAASGFITQAGRRTLTSWHGITFYDPLPFVDRITPSVSAGRVWNSSGIIKDGWITPELTFYLHAQTTLTLGFLTSDELFRGVHLNGIRRSWLRVNSNFSEPLRAGVYVLRGRVIARNLDTPVLGRGGDVNIWVAIKPIQQLLIEPEFSFSELYHPDTGDELFRGYIFRARFNYQFTRELFLRLVVQYDDFRRTLAFEPLLTYRLNAYSIFYIGSTHGFRELDEAHENGDIRRAWEFGQTSMQYFLKFQYLFQL